ncbi:MAG TPA: hypothetical protein EYP24_00975 [bacterium (Candidatus Stahlbacteria)]|nr:hypothetical protein [Candidatus Stahlbacteria bacterium]
MVTESSSANRFIIDSEAIIDGRVIDLFQMGLLSGTVFLSRISYELARGSLKGRKTMALLQRIGNGFSVQTSRNGVSEIDEVVTAAKSLNARVITTSDFVADQARRSGLEVLNIRDLLKSLLPRAEPGDIIKVRIVKRGKGSGEGVGYLEFGVKVVVDRASDKIGQEVSAIVRNALTTPSGTVLFTELL